MQTTMVALTSVNLVAVEVTSSVHRYNDVKVVDVVDVKVGDVDVKIDDIITDVKVDDVIADVIGDVIQSVPPLRLKIHFHSTRPTSRN